MLKTFVLLIFTITTCFKALPAEQKLSSYTSIAICTVNYLLFMPNMSYRIYIKNVSLCKNFIESTLKTAIMEHIHCILFYFSWNVCWVEAQVSDPGGDDSSSGGGSDL